MVVGEDTGGDETKCSIQGQSRYIDETGKYERMYSRSQPSYDEQDDVWKFNVHDHYPDVRQKTELLWFSPEILFLELIYGNVSNSQC